MSEEVKSPQNRTGARSWIRNPQDFYGGLALVGLAVIALATTRELTGMHGFAFGPGTAPRLFAGLLALVGGGVALSGLFVPGPAIERFAFRGPAYVIVAILAFAGAIRGISVTIFGLTVTTPALGLVVASYLAFIVSIMGSSEMRWLESLIAAAVMTAFCVGLFVYLLGLPFQLWPTF